MRAPTKVVDQKRMVAVKQNIMGRIVEVKMTAADAAMLARLQREHEAEKQMRMDSARKAIQRYEYTWYKGDRKKALLAINHYSAYASSEERLCWVLPLIEFAPPEIFWPAFMETWSSCDATWRARTPLLKVLQAMPPAEPFFSPAQRGFFNALPAQVAVFRGCSRSRLRGLAWTTDRTVAECFARGHRCIPVPEPVLASAIIPKEHIFFVTDDRNEQEVVLNPRRVRSLMTEPYMTMVSRAA